MVRPRAGRVSDPGALGESIATCWWSAAASTAPGLRATWRAAAGASLLCEQDDLASHTSSSATKLIHGGLRYLEYYEFGLVRKALARARGAAALRTASHAGRCAS